METLNLAEDVLPCRAPKPDGEELTDLRLPCRGEGEFADEGMREEVVVEVVVVEGR